MSGSRLDWNNVTDDTLEVDRDRGRVRAQEETSEGGLVRSIERRYRKNTTNSTRGGERNGRKQEILATVEQG